nr:pyruvate dehydrogenase kinase activator protein, KAP {N-terminal} [rats, liver, Peptide Mitochondrial Partial, 10 aa] [Rattus sp.]
KNASLAGAIE